MNTYLIARNDEINQWLEEHPAVLGSILLVMGLILLGIGLRVLATGRAKTKRGKDIEGPMAYVQGGVFAIVGIVLTAFSLTKFAAAML